MNIKDTSDKLDDLNPYEFFGFASYIPGRNQGRYWVGGGDFKRHKTLAHAKSAIRSSASSIGNFDTAPCKVYAWNGVTEAWEEVDG